MWGADASANGSAKSYDACGFPLDLTPEQEAERARANAEAQKAAKEWAPYAESQKLPAESKLKSMVRKVRLPGQDLRTERCALVFTIVAPLPYAPSRDARATAHSPSFHSTCTIRAASPLTCADHPGGAEAVGVDGDVGRGQEARGPPARLLQQVEGGGQELGVPAADRSGERSVPRGRRGRHPFSALATAVRMARHSRL